MVKPYFERDVKKPVMVTHCNIENNSNQEHETWGDTPDLNVECKYEILDDLETKLNHVPQDKRIPLIKLLLKYKSVFPDVPNRTNVLMLYIKAADKTKSVKILVLYHPFG